MTGPVNLGNPVEFTIRQLAELVIELTGSSSKIVSIRCPRMIPSSAAPTSAWPSRCSDGSRRSSFAKASPIRGDVYCPYFVTSRCGGIPYKPEAEPMTLRLPLMAMASEEGAVTPMPSPKMNDIATKK